MSDVWRGATVARGGRHRLAARVAPGVLALVALGALTALVVGAVIRPFGPTTIDPDAAASVLYFERIVGGHRLEAFVPTTPKPLLSLVFGLTWAALADWRAMTWETLALYAAAVPLAAAWVWRVVRPGRSPVTSAAAAAFVAAGLVASSDLALEVSRANSLVWALVAWLGAAIAMSTVPRRPVLAGVALMIGGLARFETFAIVAAAAVVLVALVARRGWDHPGRAGGPSGGRLAPGARELGWVVLLGAAALPIACAHDYLLTGDPLYWLGVPGRYTAMYAPSVVAAGPLEYARILAARLAPEWPLVVLAAGGFAWLVARRRWVAALGLGSLGGAMVALLFGLALRGTYISARYYEPLDLVLLSLAGFGVAGAVSIAIAVAGPTVRSVGRPREPSAPPGRSLPAAIGLVTAIAAGALLGVALLRPPAPMDRAVATSLDLVRASSANLAVYLGRLEDLAGPAPLPADAPPGAPPADPARVTLFVPSLLRPRIAVESGASLTAVGDTYASYLSAPPWPGLHAGQHIYHDRAADRPAALDRVLEADPATLGEAVAAPVLVDGRAGVWILRVVSP